MPSLLVLAVFLFLVFLAAVSHSQGQQKYALPEIEQSQLQSHQKLFLRKNEG